MESAAYIARRFGLCPLSAVIALAWLPQAGRAADAHRAVQAGPGEMVMLRSVPTRPAYRPTPPGMALIISPSPRSEITSALGADELSDADFAQLGATPAPAAQLQSAAVVRALDGMLTHGAAGSDRVTGNGVSNTISAPMGAVANATRGIGDQVQNALAQLPLGNGH